jgi:multidrug efflux system membrane fusion protein
MDDQPGPLSPSPPLPPGEHFERPRPRPDALPPAAPTARPRPHPIRSAFGWLLFLAAAAAGVWWIVTHNNSEPARTGRFTSSGPMPVGTAEVAKGDMPVVLSALGTVTPLATVTVKTQINGQLTEVAFKEGQMVKKGDFLAQIDPRPYEVALAQARGQLAKDTALLHGAEVDLARYKTLVAQNSIARQQLDTQTYLVEQDRGIVQADQAQVDNQLLNLTYCRIVAPVGGRVGLRQVDPGNYVQTSDANGIVVITQVQPISVIFTIPEDSLPAVLKPVHAGETLAADAFDRTNKNKIAGGTLGTIDNQIDTTTGTVRLRAVFENSDQSLFPNQFVNIRLRVDTLKDAAIVPVAAIQRGAPGPFVYVVKPDSTVSARPVKLGPAEDQKIAVLDGVKPGETVVVDGADRLKEGAKVVLTEPGAPGGGAPAAGGRGQGEQGGQRRQGQGQGQGQADQPTGQGRGHGQGPQRGGQ